VQAISSAATNAASKPKRLPIAFFESIMRKSASLGVGSYDVS
jgi:hypothetical protein